LNAYVLSDFISLLNECFDGAFSTDLREDSSLKDDLGIDSLRIVELLVKIEEKYEIVFPESDLNPEHLNTVRDILELIEKHVQGVK